MDRRRSPRRPLAHDRISGAQFRLELFRSGDDDCARDWNGGFLVSGSLRIQLSAEHASNLARRIRAAVDHTVCRSLNGFPGIGE